VIKSIFDMDVEKLKHYLVREYLANNVDRAIDMCKNYINQNKGKVDDDFFEIMFALYRVTNNKEKFIKLSKTYSDLTGNIGKIWREKEEHKMFSGKHVFIVDGGFNDKYQKKIESFKDSSLSRKFGRIDFNRVNVLQSNSETFQMFLDMLYAFKESEDVRIILMGDNNILDFDMEQFGVFIDKIKNNSDSLYYEINNHYVIDLENIKEDSDFVKAYRVVDVNEIEDGKIAEKFDDKKKHNLKKIDNVDEVVADIEQCEKLMYLLKMELLQWKGYEKQYIDVSEKYFEKYEEFPPQYLHKYEKVLQIKNMNMELNKTGNSEVATIVRAVQAGMTGNVNEMLRFNVREVNRQNIQYMFDYLSTTKSPIIYVDLLEVDFFDYDAAQSLLQFLNKYRGHTSKYELYIKNANKMISLTFDMIGLNDYLILEAN